MRRCFRLIVSHDAVCLFVCIHALDQKVGVKACGLAGNSSREVKFSFFSVLNREMPFNNVFLLTAIFLQLTYPVSKCLTPGLSDIDFDLDILLYCI